MRITAHLDVELIAIETDDQVSVLIELAAPPAPGGTTRAPSTLQVVLDRSGSMGGPRIAGARTALAGLVDRLDPRDNVGLVVFDTEIDVVVPAGPLTDRAAVKRAIAGVQARGGTDLSSGYLRGLQEARRVTGPAGAATVLIISDGHANVGVTDPDTLGRVAAEAYRNGVTTSTLGFGLGYDEALMSAIARGGSGNEHFAEEPDTAAALIAGEVEGLLAQTVQAASVLVGLTPAVRRVLVVNDLPSTAVDGGLMVELGGFYAAETRKLVLTFDIPGIAALGPTEVATLTFTYVELPALVQHTVTVPVTVNVVPGDRAAGRVTDPVVRTELVYLQAQRAKRRASGHLGRGDSDAALREIRQAQRDIAAARADAPAAQAADLAEEARELEYLARETEYGSRERSGKYLSASSYRKLQKRGRVIPSQEPPPGPPPQREPPAP